MAIDQAKLEEFTGRFACDFAAAMHAADLPPGTCTTASTSSPCRAPAA